MAGEELDIQVGRVPFQEAIDFFRAKQPLPTQRYTDLVHGMHDRAFVIAGVTRQDVLVDVQAAVQKALQEGTTLQEFQKSFEAAIAGKWSPRQGTAWRARVVYENNVRTAYAAGRYRQLMDMRSTHPFWRYRHGDSRRPRLQHLGWDGLVLRWDDVWWQAHYPPSAWGCRCYVDAMDEVDLEQLGKTGPDQAPPVVLREVKFGDWTMKVPDGVDPGWGYIPGQNWATWPAQSPQGVPSPSSPKASWKPLTPGNWETLGRPAQVPAEPARSALRPRTPDRDAVIHGLEEVLGGRQKIFRVGGGDWQVPLVVDAEGLGGHLPPDRGRYLGLLPELLEDPFEIWAGFLEDEVTGQVILRHRLVKAVQLDDAADKKLLLVAEGNHKGVLEAITFLPMSRARELNKSRWGLLIHGR
jgi:hypothetical protein